MDRNFFTALISQQARLLELTTALPEAALLVERFQGREAVSELFRFEIDCVSTNAYFELKTLIGEEITLQLLQADGSKRAWHGHVTEALQLGADGGLARYRLIMEPWLALLGYRCDNRQFQDLDALGILQAVFAGYPEADWSHALSQTLRVHSRLTQYAESDLDFVRRVLAEEGLGFRFAHDQSALAGDTATRARHQLVVFDRNTALPACAQGVIRFHRRDATEADDSIQAWHEARQVLPNRVSLAGWDYKTLAATAFATDTACDNGELPALEVYDGTQAYRFESSDAAAQRTDLMLAAYESGYRRFEGRGSARQLAAGSVFTLTQHQDHDGQRFTVLAVEHHGANNLGAQAARLLAATDIEAGSYRNHFMAQVAEVPVVPLPRARPVAPLQSALVVGLPGAPLTTERDHRIKIQFHWQRGDAPNAGGLTAEGDHPAQAPGDDRTGTWVRVAEWLSGPDWGSHFLPRIGTEVLVEFVGGDIDRPLVIGQLYNGEDLPPFAAGVESSANHPGTQSGWHSANHADGYNQWRIDDAPGQLHANLASSYAASQLGLGHLIQQPAGTAWRGAWRGAGFELRTDAWLAVRAGEGLLVTATARPNAISTQLDPAEAVGQLQAAQATAQALSDAAGHQGAPTLKANVAQTRFLASIDPQQDGKHTGPVGGQVATQPSGQPVERFAQPLILNEGPSDIGIASPAGLLAYAGASLHATAQQDLHLAAAHTVSVAAGAGAGWIAHAGGIQAIAAAGPLSLQAHTDAMDILADQNVTVTSSNGEIHVLAKGPLVLQAGQSSVTLQGGDITFACPGTFSVKGSSHAFLGPASQPASLETLPTGLAQVTLPQTPVETVYSQVLDFSETPDAWLPFTPGQTVQARSRGEALAVTGRTAGDPVTDGLLTPTAIQLDYWTGTDGAWAIEEEILQPGDDPGAPDDAENEDA